MTGMRYMNWAEYGKGVDVESLGADVSEGCDAVRRLGETTGATVDVVLGRGGSGLNLFLALPGLEDGATLTLLTFDEYTYGGYRDWARYVNIPLTICLAPAKIPSDTTHLVLIDNLPRRSFYFSGLDSLPDLPSLTRITFVPACDFDKGLAIPRWINECTFLKSARSNGETCTWELITTQSFPESTTRTTQLAGVRRVNPAIEHTEGCWEDFSEEGLRYAQSEAGLMVKFRAAEVDERYGQEGLPLFLSRTETTINDRFFGFLGHPLPGELFFMLESNTRPLMLVARSLCDVAYIELTRGVRVDDLRTLFGVGEFMYPIVRMEILKKLQEKRRSLAA